MRSRDPGRFFRFDLVLFAALVASAGCSADDSVCGEGTRRDGDRCVPVCGDGAERDPSSGLCVPVCVDGTRRAPGGGCLPDSAACESGQLWDVGSGSCVDVAGACAPGSTWVASEGRCVLDHELAVADVAEGDLPNDPRFGDPLAVERFELPAVGGAVTLSGTTDAAADLDDDGQFLEPDLDYWVFEVDEPALLRIRADSRGGAASGFKVVRLDGPLFYRLAVGSTGRDVERDLFLPAAGTYALIASDGLNFITGPWGPYYGAEGFGYFLEVRRLPLPAPTRLSLAQGRAEATGSFPRQPAVDGSSVTLFEIPLPGRRLYSFALEAGAFVEGVVGLVRPGVLAHDRPSTYAGLVEDETLLVAVDHSYSFALEDETAWRLRIEAQPVDWRDDGLPPATVSQPVFGAGRPLPYLWLGLGAAAGDVVRIEVDSSTGKTCVELHDEHLEFQLDRFACAASVDAGTETSGRLAILAPYGGYYVLGAIDWDLAEFDASGTRIVSIFGHDYDLSLEVNRSTPVEVGSLDAPWIVDDEPLAGPRDVRYYRARPAAGQAFLGTVMGASQPSVEVFEAGAVELVPASAATSDFAVRSIDGRPVLFGVSDATGSPAFDLRLEPLEPTAVGAVEAGTPLETGLVLAAGETRRFFRLDGVEAGLLDAELTIPRGSSLRVRQLDGELVVRSEQVVSGFARLQGATAGDGLFFELATADGVPAGGDVEVGLRAHLVPATAEGEGNPTPTQSQRLAIPEVVTAAIDFHEDRDWFRFDVTEPTIVTVATSPRGDGPVGDLLLGVGTADGVRMLVVDDDGGVGRFARAEVLLEREGTYTIAVVAKSPVAMGDYLLEVTARAP